MALLDGQTVSHYTIVSQVGSGGMGLVYRAVDTNLRRNVALKFLPPELSLDPEARNRFIQEAQAASALQHQNICTIHDIGRTNDGQMFIVMDLYDGETLQEKIARGPVELHEAVRIAVQIGEGLACAHAQGIVHRDIKPANILVTDNGTVKILDFGIAKLHAGGVLTRVGTTFGTVAYMSPEQMRGEDVDRRSDIWSLGVVFYQMLTGRLPFSDVHDQAVMYLIQHADPVPDPNVPPAAWAILVKSLQKNRTARYQDAELLLADLGVLIGDAKVGGHVVSRTEANDRNKWRAFVGWIALVLVLGIGVFFLLRQLPHTTRTAPGEALAVRRLAVLPFTNLRSDPQTNFLGYALADQITGHLAYLKTLIVRPSTMVREFRTNPTDLAKLGKDLNVDLVLTGTFLKESHTIRLNVELVDLKSDSLLWRDQLQEEYSSVFRLLDTVAENVAEGLRIEFSPEELHRMTADVPRNSVAYEYYLKGIACPASLEGNQQAVGMLRKSISIDSTFAPAYDELGFRLMEVADYAVDRERLSLASEAALSKAVSLNSGLMSAYGNLVALYTERGKTAQAYETAQMILSINKNSPEGHFFLGFVLRYAGFLERAEREMAEALQLDPGNRRFRSIGLTYYYEKKYKEALAAFDIDSASTFSLSWKAQTYLTMGEPAKAMRYIHRVLDLEPDSRFGLFCRSMEAVIEGNTRQFEIAMSEWDSSHVVDGESWYNFSEQFGRVGDAGAVSRTLRNAVDGGFFNYPLILRDPLFDSVRGNSGFQEVVESARRRYAAFKSRYPELRDAK
jgi:TolB-like protein